jgi:ParB-like chromosome segregation protein Spo0J
MTALTDIKPYDRNPRIIPQAAVDAVARSIQAFGFRQPIVVDGNGVILAGHTRYKAAQQLGLTEVPVVWQTDITEAQARGYRIADNKVAELSAWDRDALDVEVRELADLGDVNLDALGIADWELERILQEDDSDNRFPEETPPPSYSQSVNRAAIADTGQTASPHSTDSASSEVLLRIVFPNREKLDAASPEVTEVVARFGGNVLWD